MSGSNPNPTPIALELATVSGPKPGAAVLPITITNSDGTAPLLALDPSNASSTVVSLVQPIANDGSYPAAPVATYPFIGQIVAATVGTALVDLVADNIVDQQFEVAVTLAPAEVASVPPAAIIINPPG